MKVYAMERVLDSGNDMGDEKLCYEDIEDFVFAEEAIANGLVWDVETFALILKSEKQEVLKAI